MPTYEYVCAKCGHEFEKVQSIKDKPLSICPSDLCVRKPWGRGKVKRRIGLGGGLIFKGSGFYTTDYRSENYKSAAKKEAAAQTPASSDAKTPAAPAAKAETSSKADSGATSTPAPKPAKDPKPSPGA